MLTETPAVTSVTGIDDLNPVTTAGPMQVQVSFARGMSGLSDAETRELLYTRFGGVRFGTARLLGYAAAYDDVLYRFADYNAGMYSSRNAAFQEQLAYYRTFHDHVRKAAGDVEPGERLPTRKIGPHTLNSFTTEYKALMSGTWGVSRPQALPSSKT